MPNEDRIDSQRGPAIHQAHLWAIRISPYFLMVLGAVMVLIGALADRPVPVAVALVTLGSLTAIAGSVVTRAGDLKVGTSGLAAGLDSLRNIDPKSDFVLTGRATEAVVATAAQPGDNAPTIRELLLAASASGWMKTEKGDHVYLTKTNVEGEADGRIQLGDTFSVMVPTGDLDGKVSSALLRALRSGGLEWPS